MQHAGDVRAHSCSGRRCQGHNGHLKIESGLQKGGVIVLHQLTCKIGHVEAKRLCFCAWAHVRASNTQRIQFAVKRSKVVSPFAASVGIYKTVNARESN